MSCLQFIIVLGLFGYVMKWVYKQAQEAKLERQQAKADRVEMLKSIKAIEVQVTDLDKVLHPIEKRHFR